MSLSRILNDDPSPSLATPSHLGTVSPMSFDPAYAEIPPDPMSALPVPSRLPRMYPDHQVEQQHSLRGYGYHSSPYQTTAGWDQHTRQWAHDDMFPFNSSPSHLLETGRRRIPSPHEIREASADLCHRDGDEDVAYRKRRKGGDEDSDYQPPSQRRTLRRYMPRNKLAHVQPPLLGVSEFKLEGSEEDLRLTSSDLDDCTEVWIGELSDYVLETQKRQKQVEKWFEASILERNSLTAQAMSRHYAAKLASIPPPPPTPPLLIHDDEYLSNTHVNGYDDGNDELGGYGVMDHLGSTFGPDADAATRLRSQTARGALKRHAMGGLSEGSSDHEGLVKKDRSGSTKKRRIDGSVASDDADRSIIGDHLSPSVLKALGSSAKGKGKGKLVSQRELSHDSVSLTPGNRRRRSGPKRKLDHLLPERLDLLGLSHSGGLASGDVTPAFSRPASPATALSIVYELDEPIPPLKRAKKIDDAAMLKRVKALEDTQRKVWVNIARRDVPKVYKYHAMGYQSRQAQLERIARLASTQARKPFTRTAKGNKDIQAKAKRLMREMLVFWKKNEREERDVRKREQKEATDRAKVEEEKREAARQARKLEFLISQTELYSHFVGSKLKTAEVDEEAESQAAPVGAELEDVDPSSLVEINFDDEDHSNLHRHARYNAQEAIAMAKQRAIEFDTQAAFDRKINESLQLAKDQKRFGNQGNDAPTEPTAPLVDLDSDELNFQNPTSLSGQLTIKQPQMLMAQLKEYQLKGLNWLATLYEQGINGILADEMGLGKTVQSISLLAYLAETHDIWGPFLVVAPLTTLHNWQQELTRFLPRLKALPYWGNVKDRATLRKFWSKKEISYNQDAPFHVLITSYHLIIQDQQYFQRVKWQYMILDEAQNIKNSSSVRWKTLLGFHCRNRLLLTGTPIQNSMQELWALLHFIMPSLFDSHDEFNEWFSKDIENAAENKGSKLNEHQLRRLHTILKPFMLRRVKRHVQNELSDKIEKDIYVDLSARQRKLYRALLANVSVADLLEKAANIGDADSARSLMNLVMQFRKVCNHPELFERADVVAPFSFSRFGRSSSLQREGDIVSLAYSTRNPIEIAIPRILYEDGGLLDIPSQNPRGFSGRGSLPSLFNIWSTDWLQYSLYGEESSAFAFLRLLDMSPGQAHACHDTPLICRLLSAAREESRMHEEEPYILDPTFIAHSAAHAYRMPMTPPVSNLDIAHGQPSMHSIAMSAWTQSCLSRSYLRWFVPPVVAPTISMYCDDRTFLERQLHFLEDPLDSLALYGLPPYLREVEAYSCAYEDKLQGLSTAGLFGNSPSHQLPLSTMQVPDAKRLINDSAKLARLDALLQELKTGDHRVLIYSQMTRMMDLMEEYLIYRQYKYLRLDGSSKLEDRRDMVIDWQTRSDIFVFLLSTRAGGLGINLTAADTVIFYDHDWNPSNDAQAMDRAHRLGQTRQVTVYRLISKGTIDERIVQLARVKKDVQDIVVGNKNFTDVTKPSEIVQLLLNDDQLAGLDSSTANGLSSKRAGKRPAENVEGEPVRDLWNEEGDDFFVHMGAGGPNQIIMETVDDENGTATPGVSRGKKRKAPGAGRGRRTGPKTTRVRRSLKSGTTSMNATPDWT